MASIDLIRASNGSGDAVKATVTNARVISSTTLQVSAITNFPSKFIATVGSVDGTGAFVPATVTVFNGHTSSGNIEIDSFAPGYTDLGNTPGQIVVLKPTTAWANEIADVVGAAHNDNGTLKANSVNTAAITDANVTTAKIADAAVTSSKIDFTTIPDFNFSTTEQATKQKWVNGDIIYQKSFTGTTALPTTHGISNLKDVFRIDAMVRDASGSWRPIPWGFAAGSYATADLWLGGVSISSTVFGWQLGSSLGSFTQCRVTVWYSKT